tara:strand:+ start:1184 stop:1471 length:288 start_codon:yes stop_codon:yes gene_type:complete
MKKLVNGELLDMTDAEIAEATSGVDVSPFDNLISELREVRNSLLQETDWMTCSDAPTITDEWKNYRQSLRDITKDMKTVDDVRSVTWPTKPKGGK